MDKQTKQAKEMAKKIYLSVYRKHKKMDLKTAVSVSEIVIEEVLTVVPQHLLSKGLLGDIPNPEYDFWMTVKKELQNTEA
jgi:hypothetical protein